MGKKRQNETYYLVEDDIKMTELWRKIITLEDVDCIYYLYKRYVDGAAPYPIVGCGSCELSASKYYERLRDWHLENKNLFV